MRFTDPWFAVLFLFIPYILHRYFKKEEGVRIRFSTTKKFKRQKNAAWRHSLVLLRCAAILLLIIVLMRPQSGETTIDISSEGVDIILAIDTSGSMKAMDFEIEGERVTRLNVVKNVVKEFISNRKADRIGMVVFGGEAFTQSPLTLDHGMLLTFLEKLEVGMAGDATAIGSAIGTAVKRLKDRESKSKLILLLTDGKNNAGAIHPEKAAEIAKTYKIKIYTIGAGTRGEAPFLMDTLFGKRFVYQPVDLDEDALRNVAEMTGARYFRATDTQSLKNIYTQIDNMEKSEAKIKKHTEYTELFPWFLTPAIFILILEVFLANTRFRKIP